jgi:hypothetical protein
MGCSGRLVTAVAQVLLECADELIRNEITRYWVKIVKRSKKGPEIAAVTRAAKLPAETAW